MRNLVVRGLRAFKWRLLVPAVYWLGLPHQRVADALRLVPLKRALGRDVEVAEPGPVRSDAASDDPEARYPGPPRYSIYTAPNVASACSVLRDRLGEQAMDEYVEGLVEGAPEYEPDVRWGRFLVQLDITPSSAFEEGERLLARFPLRRLRKSLYQQYNQVGNIHRSRELVADLQTDAERFERTCQILDARARMLKHGVPMPERKQEPSYTPVSRRVFYLLHNALPLDSGGYATRTHGIARALKAQGWELECVTRLGYPGDIKQKTPWVPPVEKVEGISYRRLLDPSRSYRRLDAERYLEANAERVLKEAKKRRPALLHGASNHINGIAAVYAARKLGLPSIYEVRGLWELTRLSRQPEFEGSELYNMIVRLETQACQDADQVITITHGLKDLMVERGVDADKISVVPNGVDTDRFQPMTRDETMAEQFEINGRMVLGYVGSMPQYEGLDDLLHAVALLPEERRRQMFVLLVGDGDQFDNLLALRDRLGLMECVHFTGRIPFEEVDRLYSLVDVATFPRKPQPVAERVSPMKPFEAMAMGKPVLASDVAALAEVVSHEETGLLFEKGNREALAQAIDRLVSDEGLRRHLSDSALTWVRENRDWRILTRDIVRLYDQLT